MPSTFIALYLLDSCLLQSCSLSWCQLNEMTSAFNASVILIDESDELRQNFICFFFLKHLSCPESWILEFLIGWFLAIQRGSFFMIWMPSYGLLNTHKLIFQRDEPAHGGFLSKIETGAHKLLELCRKEGQISSGSKGFVAVSKRRTFPHFLWQSTKSSFNFTILCSYLCIARWLSRDCG